MHPYANREAVLTSKHQKLRLIDSSFRETVGLEIIEVALDTDQFGTFSGEIERTLAPLEAAVAKARMGINETGILIGIASEGSIGPDPLIPFLTSDIEHIVLVDEESGIQISEVYRSFDIVADRIRCVPNQDLTDFLQRADFPHHQLIVKTERSFSPLAVKGISDLDELYAAIGKCSRESETGSVVIESDLRANRSPSRAQNIFQAGQLLSKRLGQLCPHCRTPGWGRVDYERGALCGSCSGYVETAIRAEINGCVQCDFREVGRAILTLVEPAQCPWCNP